MADIAAADVSAKILYQKPYAPDSEQPTNEPLIHVRVGITIDPGTTDAYPTGGIPLTNLFTSGNASDTKLDTNRKIIHKGAANLRASASVLTPSLPCFFHQGGSAAADQKLILCASQAVLGPRLVVSGTTLAAAASGNVITDSGNGLAGFKVGEPILISGFTGTAANNQVGVISAVAAGQISVTTAVAFVNDAAGETVTLTSLWPLPSAVVEYPNTDITLTNGIAGDTDPYVEIDLIGFLRPGETL